VPALHLGQGTYFVSCSVRYLNSPRTRDDILHYLEKAAHFSVRYPGRNITHRSIYEPPVSFREDA
jgi:hypothetical protein